MVRLIQPESGTTPSEQQRRKEVVEDGKMLLGGFRLLKLTQFHHVTAYY